MPVCESRLHRAAGRRRTCWRIFSCCSLEVMLPGCAAVGAAGSASNSGTIWLRLAIAPGRPLTALRQAAAASLTTTLAARPGPGGRSEGCAALVQPAVCCGSPRQRVNWRPGERYGSWCSCAAGYPVSALQRRSVSQPAIKARRVKLRGCCACFGPVQTFAPCGLASL